jgi:hypothetical protein
MGEPIDFWCENELAWKSGTVTEVNMKNNTLTIVPKKGP